MDKKNFYDVVRKHFGAFKQSQVDGFEVILGEWDASGLVDLRWLAYRTLDECQKRTGIKGIHGYCPHQKLPDDKQSGILREDQVEAF